MEKRNKPYVVKEEPGIRYYCACGKSASLPHCDGSHAGSGINPFRVEINEEKNVAICGCGLSAGMPFCDGAHKTMH
jgi:CDGSH-type Zn-finger protein